MFGYVDFILIGIVLLFTIGGLFYGFIKSLGNLVGLIGGIWIGSTAVSWLSQHYGLASRPILAVTVFLIVLMLVSYIVGWVFEFFNGLYKILSIIPFLKSINKLLGGIFGFVEGILLVVALQIFASIYIAETGVGSALLDSTVMSWIGFLRGIVERLLF